MDNLSLDNWRDLVTAMNIMLMMIWAVAAIILTTFHVVRQAVRLPSFNFKLSAPSPYTDFYWWWVMPLAIGLRVPMMTQSAWYDETFTGVMASVPLEKFWTALAGDVHPPLYYLLAKISVTLFGYSDGSLRLPAFIAGLLLIPAMYRLTMGLLKDKTIAQIVAAITAVLPAMIHYSDEARYPMLLALLVVVAMIALIEDMPALWAICLFALPQIHATGLVYAVCLTLVMFLYLRFDQWLDLFLWLGTLFPTCLSALSVVVLAVGQATDVANGFWLLPVMPLAHITEGTLLLPPSPGDIVAYLAVVLLSISGAAALWRQSPHASLLVAVAVAVPALIATATIVWHPVYLPRALLASSLVLVPGWALLVQRHLVWQVLLCIALIVSIPSMFNRTQTIELRDLMAKCAGADYVYTTSTSMSIVAKHYTPSGSHVISYWDGNSINQSLPLPSRLAMGFDIRPIEFVTGQVCMVTQWNAYTSDSEISHVNNLKRRYQPEIEPIQASDFVVYTVMKWYER